MYVKKTLLMHLDEVVEIIKSTNGFQNDKNKSECYFTDKERIYCAERFRCLGARFIIKKCVFDYLSSEKGYVEYKYCEIEVINNERGQPMLRLFRDVRTCVKKMNIKNIFISISHSKNWIAGMVLFCY